MTTTTTMPTTLSTISTLSPIQPTTNPLDPIRVAQRGLDQWYNLGCVLGQTLGRYTYPDGTHCIIGNALTPELLAKIEPVRNYDQIEQILDILDIPEMPESTIDELTAMQLLHDNVCRANLLSDRELRQALLTEFRQHLERIAARAHPAT